ncbi:MAG: hypothetical protein Q8K92_04600 [Leadbetterella sp.]|nr:hypothetical protein [Leadbetterella sp.]
MNKFIAYFDILGFKEYIYKRESVFDLVKRDMEHLLLDTQKAVSEGKLKPIHNNPIGVMPDLENKKVNCLNISDSIIFWTDDDDYSSFLDIFRISSEFYKNSLRNSAFLLRGSLGHGQIEYTDSQHKDEKTYASQLLYGKALIDTYIMAEKQQSASFCLTESIMTYLDKTLIELEEEKKIIKDYVYFKNEDDPKEVCLIPPNKGWFTEEKEIEFKNKFVITDSERPILEDDFKMMKEEVKSKMENTLKLFRSLHQLL